MRDGLVLLSHEVPPGHASLLRAEAADALPLTMAGSPIAYGRDALEGVAWFTRLRAAQGIDARVLPEGRAAGADPDEARPRPATVLALGLAAVTFVGGLWLGLRRRPA